MCFAVSKIPQGKVLDNGVLKTHPQYEEQMQVMKMVEETQRNPLSMGKHRNRAK
jgi:hypothetical protein